MDKRRKIVHLVASSNDQEEDLQIIEPSAQLPLTFSNDLASIASQQGSQDVAHDFLHASWSYHTVTPSLQPQTLPPPPTESSSSTCCTTAPPDATQEDLGLEFALCLSADEDEKEEPVKEDKSQMYDNDEEDLILLEDSSSPVPPPKPKYIPPPYEPIKKPRILPKSFQQYE